MLRKTVGVAFLGVVLGSLSAQVPEVRTVYRAQPIQPQGWNLWLGDQDLGPSRNLPGAPAVTPDGRHTALMTSPTGPEPVFRLVLDGSVVGEWKTYGWVGAPQLRDDGSSWAVQARSGGEGPPAGFTLIDGQAFGPFRNAGPVVWSSKPGHWSFSADLEKGKAVFVDGQTVGPFQGSGPVVWDPTGTKAAFSFDRNGARFLWVDGKEVGPFQDDWLITRPDGAWMGYTSTGKDNRFTVVVGGKSYGPYDWVDPRLDWIRADGQKWTSRVSKKGVSYLLDTGKETKLDSLDFGLLPDGGPYYRWGGFQNWSLSIKGQVLGPYDGPTPPLQFRDGSAWAFQYEALPGKGPAGSFVQIQDQKPQPGTHLKLISDGDGEAFTWFSGGQGDEPLVYHRWTKAGPSATTIYTVAQTPPLGRSVTANGATFGPYSGLRDPVVTPDGLHWGVLCWLQGGRVAALVDGVQSLATGPVDNAMGLVLSDNGASWAFRTWPVKGSDQQKLVLNDRESGPYRSVDSLEFSPDGRHAMAWRRTLDNKNSLLFDRKTYGPNAQGQERHLFDLEAGHFVTGISEKGAQNAVTDEGTFGPYRNLDPISRGPLVRDSNTGHLFGFVGTLKDGRQELRVVTGMAGGGKTYGPYRRLANGPSFLSADGQEWIFPLEKEGVPGQGYLHNGVEVTSDGWALRPLGSGYLMMVRSGGQESLVKDGTSVGSWSHVIDWRVARDGKTWLAEVQEAEGPDSRRLVLVNGAAQPGTALALTPGPEGDRFTWFSLSANGEGQVHSLMVH